MKYHNKMFSKNKSQLFDPKILACFELSVPEEALVLVACIH